ncbi:MAG: hypothetical protein ACP5UH_01230 [Candidatus Micrarchaeia archaeon]
MAVFGIYAENGDSIVIGADKGSAQEAGNVLKLAKVKKVCALGKNTIFAYAGSDSYDGYKLIAMRGILEKYSAELDSDLESGLRKARAELLEIADGGDTLLFAGLTKGKPSIIKVALEVHDSYDQTTYDEEESMDRFFPIRIVDEGAIAIGKTAFDTAGMNERIKEYLKLRGGISVDKAERLAYMAIRDTEAAERQGVDIFTLERGKCGWIAEEETDQSMLESFEGSYERYRQERVTALAKSLELAGGLQTVNPMNLDISIRNDDKSRLKI